MSCPGLHCASCSTGVSIPPLGLTAAFGLAWVAEHLIEVALVSATCGILSVAAVFVLLRWADRRDGRYAARGSLSVTRAEAIPLTATVTPQVTQPERPAIPQVVNFNFYGTDGTMAARVIRQQIPGIAGDAITEGNDHG